MGPDTEPLDPDYYTCWRLMVAEKDSISDFGSEIAAGTKYYQKYLIFTTVSGTNKLVETRMLTEKEYFLWQLKGNDGDTKGIL